MYFFFVIVFQCYIKDVVFNVGVYSRLVIGYVFFEYFFGCIDDFLVFGQISIFEEYSFELLFNMIIFFGEFLVKLVCFSINKFVQESFQVVVDSFVFEYLGILN